MPQVKPENIESFARIKVIGIGGSGNNSIGRMIEADIKGVEFVAINTDAQQLHYSKAASKIHIGKNLTRGLGAGMNPEIGRQAAEESREEIYEVVKDTDMVFVTCGLGGGTGTGAAPIVAEAARDAGVLTVAIVTRPFSFEGDRRGKIALQGLANLSDKVDTLLTIPNDRIFNIIDENTPLTNAFGIVDDVLRQAVQGISDLITLPGIINLDFADVRAIMQNAGVAMMGVGVSSGDDRAIEAAKAAINSPLLELSIDGARGVLFNVSGNESEDVKLAEVNRAAKAITESIDSDAKVIFGTSHDPSLNKGEFKVTVIATGFDQEKQERMQTAPNMDEEPYEPSYSGEDSPTDTPETPTEDTSEPQEDLNFNINPIESEEESEFEIPAFIRKKIKKVDETEEVE